MYTYAISCKRSAGMAVYAPLAPRVDGATRYAPLGVEDVEWNTFASAGGGKQGSVEIQVRNLFRARGRCHEPLDQLV